MISPRDRHLGRQFGVAAALVALLWLVANPAEAVPIDDPHIGGIGFSGPTTGDLAAVYWNPAALGLMHGQHLTFTGTARLSTITASLAGQPDAQALDRSQPFISPPGPGAFAGISTDVGDRFALAFAAYMPFVERSSYASPAGTEPGTRYHRISTDLRNLAFVPALAVRFAGDFRLGVAPGFLFSTGRLSFDEYTPTGDARADLGSGLGLGSSSFAYTLGVGLYFRVRAWEFGFSYSSAPLGAQVSDSAVIKGDGSQVTLPGGVPLTCPPYGGRNAAGVPDGSGCVFADVAYKLPSIWIAGVTWHPGPGWDISGIARILSFGSNDVIDIRLTEATPASTGSTLASAGIPQHIVLHRGYGTVVDTRVRVGRWVSERLRLGAGLRVETSALPSQAVSPATVDAGKLEPTVMASLRVVRHLWIDAGYGFTYMLPVTVTSSIFDPNYASQDPNNPSRELACTQAGGDLNSSACMERLNGTARPSANGTYRHFEHDFTLSVTAQF